MFLALRLLARATAVTFIIQKTSGSLRKPFIFLYLFWIQDPCCLLSPSYINNCVSRDVTKRICHDGPQTIPSFTLETTIPIPMCRRISSLLGCPSQVSPTLPCTTSSASFMKKNDFGHEKKLLKAILASFAGCRRSLQNPKGVFFMTLSFLQLALQPS